MMKNLTDKQRNMLDFIDRFQESKGMPPTVYEIAEHFSIKVSTAFAHLKALERKDCLSRSSKARSIHIRKPPRSLKMPIHMSFTLPIPLLGRINAGLPVESIEENSKMVMVDRNLVNSRSPQGFFALEVQGESMKDAGILDRDIVIVKQTGEKVRAGDVVVALVDNESTVKYYHPSSRGRIELRPANRAFSSVFFPAKDVTIQGVVVALQRKY